MVWEHHTRSAGYSCLDRSMLKQIHAKTAQLRHLLELSFLKKRQSTAPIALPHGTHTRMRAESAERSISATEEHLNHHQSTE